MKAVKKKPTEKKGEKEQILTSFKHFSYKCRSKLELSLEESPRNQQQKITTKKYIKYKKNKTELQTKHSHLKQPEFPKQIDMNHNPYKEVKNTGHHPNHHFQNHQN